MSSHLVYPETYGLCSELLDGRHLIFLIYLVFLRFLFHVVLFVSLCPRNLLISVLLDLFDRFVGLSLGTYRTYVFGNVQDFLNFVGVLLVFLCWDLHLFHYQCLFFVILHIF